MNTNSKCTESLTILFGILHPKSPLMFITKDNVMFMELINNVCLEDSSWLGYTAAVRTWNTEIFILYIT
jgi:hypothetical protein